MLLCCSVALLVIGWLLCCSAGLVASCWLLLLLSLLLLLLFPAAAVSDTALAAMVLIRLRTEGTKDIHLIYILCLFVQTYPTTIQNTPNISHHHRDTLHASLHPSHHHTDTPKKPPPSRYIAPYPPPSRYSQHIPPPSRYIACMFTPYPPPSRYSQHIPLPPRYIACIYTLGPVHRPAACGSHAVDHHPRGQS